MPKKVLQARSLILVTNMKNLKNSFFVALIKMKEIGNAQKSQSLFLFRYFDEKVV